MYLARSHFNVQRAQKGLQMDKHKLKNISKIVVRYGIGLKGNDYAR